MEVLPTQGRIVLFHTWASSNDEFESMTKPAMITEVHPIDGTVKLCVFHSYGIQFVDAWTKQGTDAGSWDWMPFQKDQQARLAGDAPVNAGVSAAAQASAPIGADQNQGSAEVNAG